MGFNEVEACVKEFLGINKGQNLIEFNALKFGTRQTTDKAVLIENNEKILEQFNKLHPKQRPIKKPVLLVTGASGFLGNHLLEILKKKETYEIWLLGRDKQNFIEHFGTEFKCFDHNDFSNDLIHLGNVDTLLHLGFARPHKSNFEIAKSLAFSNKLFTKASLHNIPYIINVSSQSVYGNETILPWTEESTINPQNTYAQAKFAVENFLENIHQINLHGKFTSLRLSTLIGLDSNKVDFISKMIDSSFQCHSIQVYGGHQIMQRLDVKDAAEAICVLIEKRKLINDNVYNLGSNEEATVLDLAYKIKELLEKSNHSFKVKVDKIHTEKW
jgi:nucleoside-diphosphate-sugar epimerase